MSATPEMLKVLRRMADGEHIAFSRDGEIAWLHKDSPHSDRAQLDDELVWALRDQGFTAKNPKDEYGGDYITAKGRAVVEQLTQKD